MRSAGCAPHDIAEILPDGEDHYFRLEADRKDKRGAYCLTITPDGFSYGNFTNFKTGDKGSWHSGKGVKALSKEERTANEARYKALEAERRAKVDARHAQAAIEAQALWDSCLPAIGHPYLDKKGVQAHGAMIDGDDLIYQAVNDGKIWTYQRIQPDGTKLFLTGGKKQGCYYPMTTADESKDIIALCEGIATAASIRQATNLPVFAAFDAGNLVPVAKEIRAKYPTSLILIAADNDCNGDKNTGILSAQQAATKSGGHVTWPEFEEGSELTDWNDAHILYGLEHVKNKILAAIQLAVREAPEGIQAPKAEDVQTFGGDIPGFEPDDLVPFDAPIESGKLSPVFDDKKISNSLIWKKWPTEMESGKMEPNSLHNILVFMRHKPKYVGLFRYDRFAGRIILSREPFWNDEVSFKIREIRDNDTSYITASMEKDGLSPTGAKVREAIEVCAHENWINPPLEYFENLKWDRVPRLNGWLKRYLGAEGDAEYLSAVGMAFLIAGVARIYDPGCKAENMLVLEGNQGLLKSTALNVLANVGRGADEESYFCDTLSFDQITEKDSVLKMQGKLIIEIPDLAGLGSREIEAVKAWMSVQTDEIRVPYGREMMKFPRKFILAGSTNESHWLKDQTGNRRFWPVKCGKIDIESLKADREQLWAEAVHLYKNKAIWWIGRDNPVWSKVTEEQSDRLLEDIWFQPIQAFVKGRDFITIKEILEHMKIEIKDQTSRHQKQVINVLKALKFSAKKKRIYGGSINGWERITDNVIDGEFEEIDLGL